MMLQLCHSISPLIGASALWYLKQVIQEHASDPLEAIMGVRELDPNWIDAGNCVGQCCVTTFEVWANHYDADVKSLSSLLGLRGLVDHVTWHRNFKLRIEERNASRAGCHTALYRKIRWVPHCSIQTTPHRSSPEAHCILL